MKKILGLDVSTKTIGVALFNEKGKLLQLTHVSPKLKPVPEDKQVELMLKSDVFKEWLEKYKDIEISRVIIEEPLLYSNNVFTVGTLTKFNGLISRICYDTLGVMPEYVSTYDARSISFPELVKPGKTKKEVLFGGLPMDIDKKHVIWELVCNLQPELEWLYSKPTKRYPTERLKKECYDMTDAYVVAMSVMKRDGKWLDIVPDYSILEKYYNPPEDIIEDINETPTE